MKNLIVKFTTKPEGRAAFMEALLENRKESQKEEGVVGDLEPYMSFVKENQ